MSLLSSRHVPHACTQTSASGLQCAAVCCSVLQQCAAVCGSVLQYVAVCCSVLQRVRAHVHTHTPQKVDAAYAKLAPTLQRTATHLQHTCNTLATHLQHTCNTLTILLHCNTLTRLIHTHLSKSTQHTATHCNTIATHSQHTCSTLQHTDTPHTHTPQQVDAALCNALQRTCNNPATHCNTLTCLVHTHLSKSTQRTRNWPCHARRMVWRIR